MRAPKKNVGALTQGADVSRHAAKACFSRSPGKPAMGVYREACAL